MGTPSGSDPVVKAGDTVEGRYRIIKTVGEGGMGTVYLAEHVLIKRRVALKILRREFATDGDVIDRFMNEARAAGTLGHPNIVESTDMGFTRDDVPYIVFEYLEGSLLTDEIYRVKGMPPRRALRIGVQIASALHAAHTAGIVHRDLKSDNVFLTDKEEASDHVKVLDFGISRFLEAENDSSGPRNTTMGTPEFMAPEQITSPETVDARADIYALGVVLFEMLTARLPFSNPAESSRSTRQRVSNSDQLLHRIINEDPPSIDRPDAPPGLEELIHDKLLAKDPARRFQSMKDVQAAFEAFTGVSRRDSAPIPLASLVEMPKPEPPASAKVVELPPPPKRRLAWLWLVTAVIAAASGGATLLAGNKSDSAAAEQAATAGLQADAEKIAATMDSEARAAHLRADGMVASPMLRAGIETDAATLHDMAANESLFKPAKGEIVEVYQLRDGKESSILRLPASAPPIKAFAAGTTTRVVASTTGVTMEVSAPITTQQSAIGGSLAIAAPIDLASIKAGVASHAIKASLTGLGSPIELVAGAVPAASKPIKIPIKASAEGKISNLSLDAVIAAPTATGGDLMSRVRYCLWCVGGILLLIYLASLLRTRRQG